MADMFSEIESIYNVAAVSDFCNSRIQQLPFNSQYVKQAANQLVAFYNKLDLSRLSNKCKQVCIDIIDNLVRILSQETFEFNNLVICYEDIRMAIVMIVLLYNEYGQKACDTLIEYKTCLEYIEEGKTALAIDLGESAIAHSTRSRIV